MGLFKLPQHNQKQMKETINMKYQADFIINID